MKNVILDSAEAMVQREGLASVSFQQLADAVGLSKASIFHHFPSRDALAHALIERCSSKYGTRYTAIVSNDDTAPSKLRKLAGYFEMELKEGRMCLLAALGSSQATLSEALQAELQETANASIQIFARVFEQGREEGTLHFGGEPIDAARSFLAILQGSQQIARYSNDLNVFSSSVESYISSLIR